MGGRGVGTVTERDRRGEYSVRSEAATLIRLAVPSSLANVTLGISFCVVLMISRYGTDAIAGAGLGLMWVNITAQSLFVGTQFGGGALMAQAFGARNHRRVGLLLQRQLLMNWLLCIPIAAVWFYTEEILLALGQPPRVSHFAGEFVKWQLPGLPFLPAWMCAAPMRAGSAPLPWAPLPLRTGA